MAVPVAPVGNEAKQYESCEHRRWYPYHEPERNIGVVTIDDLTCFIFFRRWNWLHNGGEIITMGIFLTLLAFGIGFAMIYYGLFWVILGIAIIVGLVKLARGD